jgi:hypothetical protein
MAKKPILSQRVLEQHASTRYDRERRTRKFIVIGSIVVTIVVVLLIVVYVLQVLVFEPNRTVASVGGEDIHVTQVQSRMKLEFADLSYSVNQIAQQVQQIQQSQDANSSFLLQYYQQQFQQMATQVTEDQISNRALDALITEALVRQEAKRRNIGVSADEVAQEMEKSIGYHRVTLTPFPTYTPVTPKPTVTPAPLTASLSLTATAPITSFATATPEPTATPRLQPTSITNAELDQGRQRGEQFYTSLGYPASQFMHIYDSSLLTTRLQDAFAQEVPTQTQHYRFDYVRFNTIESATQYSQLLAGGKITFDAVITAANTITQPAPIGLGSQQGWMSKLAVEGQFGNEVLATLEGGALNTPSSVITSQLTGGFYLVVPLERGIRPLDDNDLSQAQRKLYDDWLTAAKADTTRVQRKIDPLTIMPRDVKTNIASFQSQLGNSGLGSGGTTNGAPAGQ